MEIIGLDREGIMAELRRRFGSAFEFERAHGLPHRSVSDVLRGRPNGRVTKALEQELSKGNSIQAKSDMSDDRAESAAAHRLNAGAR